MTSDFPTAVPVQLNYAQPPARSDLRQIAVRQKAIQYCILGYFLSIALAIALPGPLKLIAGLVLIGAAIAGAVFVFMLAIAIYSTGAGIVLGILTLIPYIGLIPLLVVNGKATKILRAHGITVGLLGAKTSQIPAPGIGAQ